MNQKHNKQNQLSESTSPYLLDAADQPVHWFLWGEQAFQVAQAEDKPILLDIGAVWCHWCHVIDRESYSNPEIARLINTYFIPVKVDRDERPEIDSRYQKAVQMITGQGGWPLTAFLTPEGEVFYGGTYFPPESRYGRPGMRDILPQIAEYYREHRNEIGTNIRKIRTRLEEMTRNIPAGEFHPQVIHDITKDILESYDPEYGGFGHSPKFPHTTALELLMHRFLESHEEQTGEIIRHTLTSMANGGFHDQLGGAFHRYSTDPEWHVPHFEVMSYVNSELLRLYLYGWQIFSEDYFRDIAEHLVEYVLRKGADTVNGGFYASQDADYSMDDDGDFWTWSVREFEEILEPDEVKILREYYGVEDRGDMQENPEKNVLRQVKTAREIAGEQGMDQALTEAIIEAGSRKLLIAREERPEPFIDTTLYTNWNAMMADAFFEAGRILQRTELVTLAEKTMNRIWDEGWNAELGLPHRLQGGSAKKSGLLTDQVFYARAALSAFECTGNPGWLRRATECLHWANNHLWDNEYGGYFDVVPDKSATGYLGIVEMPVQDSPVPGANAVAGYVLSRLYFYTGKGVYYTQAETLLERFAAEVKSYGVFAGMYGIAANGILHYPLRIVVYDAGTSALWKTAIRAKHPGDLLHHITDAGTDESAVIPDFAREMLKAMPEGTSACALICTDTECTKPVMDTTDLLQRLGELRKRQE